MNENISPHTYLHELHCNKFEAFVLKSGDDLSNQTSLYTIWLDHDEGSFSLSCHC